MCPSLNSGANGVDTGLTMDVGVQGLIEESRRRRQRRLLGRERLTQMAVSGAFLLVATGMAISLPAGRGWSIAALPVLLAYVLVARIDFEVGAVYTVPTQLVFVPMLFVVPTPQVPLVVAACFIAGKLPDYTLGRIRPGRALVEMGDAWHAVGPALVLSLAGVSEPALADWPLYVAALASQFALDQVVTIVRERAVVGTSPFVQVRVLAWIHAIDALLAPIGLLVAISARQSSFAVVLVLPLVALLRVFARERHERIDQAIELSHAYRGTALLLGDVVEVDDEYTGRHTQGVVELAIAVAYAMDVDERTCRDVELGALLHDVGKIAVPKAIINKPGPLTDEEWEIVRSHTIVGQQMLERVGGVLTEVGVIVRASHERWDGSGYPDGLRTEAIPLAARIVAACDAYNAMTTDRSYRRALPAGLAIEEMRSSAGTQFDPDVVDALVRVAAPHDPDPPRGTPMTSETQAAPMPEIARARTELERYAADYAHAKAEPDRLRAELASHLAEIDAALHQMRSIIDEVSRPLPSS
jgi:hypothetical protein